MKHSVHKRSSDSQIVESTPADIGRRVGESIFANSQDVKRLNGAIGLNHYVISALRMKLICGAIATQHQTQEPIK